MKSERYKKFRFDLLRPAIEMMHYSLEELAGVYEHVPPRMIELSMSLLGQTSGALYDKSSPEWLGIRPLRRSATEIEDLVRIAVMLGSEGRSNPRDLIGPLPPAILCRGTQLAARRGRFCGTDQLLELLHEVTDDWLPDAAGSHRSGYILELGEDFLQRSETRKVSWANLVAAFGLAKIELSLRELVSGKIGDAINALSDAGLCLASAENQIALDEFEEWLRHHQKSKASKFAMLRHQGNHALKARAIQLFKAKKWKSTLQASRAVFDQLKKENFLGKAKLTDDRGPDTVYGWLRASLKGAPAHSQSQRE